MARFYLLVARVGLFRCAPFTALIGFADRRTPVRFSFVVKPTSRWFSSGFHIKQKNVPLGRLFVLLVARVGFEPTTRGL